MKERDIEGYLVKRVKALGGEVRKVQWAGRDGAPDRLVMLPSRQVSSDKAFGGRGYGLSPRALWVELKAPGLAATFPKNAHERKQLREHTRMRLMGQQVYVLDSFEGIDSALEGS